MTKCELLNGKTLMLSSEETGNPPDAMPQLLGSTGDSFKMPVT